MKKYYINFVLSLLFSTVIWSKNDDNKFEVTRKNRLEYIDDSTVSHLQARRLALQHYLSDENSKDFNLIEAEETVVILGFDLKGYATEGQKLWQVSLYVGNPRKLLAVVFVNPDDEKCYIVIGD